METKFKLTLIGNYSFVLTIKNTEDGKWEGRVIRFIIKPVESHWGKGCGSICRAETESKLLEELNCIISQHFAD